MSSSIPLSVLNTPTGGLQLQGSAIIKYPSVNPIFKQMTGTTPNSNGTGNATFNNFDSNWVTANSNLGVSVPSPGVYTILAYALGSGLTASNTSFAPYVDVSITIGSGSNNIVTTNRYNINGYNNYNGYFSCPWNLTITNPSTQYIGVNLNGGGWSNGGINLSTLQILRIAAL